MKKFILSRLVYGLIAFLIVFMKHNTSAAQQKSSVCMWDEAVCQREDTISIGTVATDSDLSKLDNLQGIKQIYISGLEDTSDPIANITDSGFLHIQNLRELEVLDAIGLPLLTDASLRGLSKLSHLQEARFEGNKNFTATGISYLQGLSDLRILTFTEHPSLTKRSNFFTQPSISRIFNLANLGSQMKESAR